MTMSFADQRLREFQYIINKLNKLGLSEQELKNISYQKRCNLLNNNPVFVARNFQYRVKYQQNHT